ncbi:MAG TPA: DUF5110 domain-containing protein, partial [Candidatus Acidoferrales bacterium]|nr:DUF5110 domain-containing protein [Candidatus Acidoferrales bacterium]
GLTEAYQQGSFRQTSLTYRHTPTGDQIDVSAPKGSFRPAPRDLVFTVRSTSKARKVLIDGKVQGGAALAKYPTVRIADDGRSHRIELR